MELIVKAPTYLADQNKHAEAHRRQVDFMLGVVVPKSRHHTPS